MKKNTHCFSGVRVDSRLFLSSQSATANKSEKDRLSRVGRRAPRGPMRYSGEVCGSLAMRRVITLSLSTGPPRVDHGCLSWPMS